MKFTNKIGEPIKLQRCQGFLGDLLGGLIPGGGGGGGSSGATGGFFGSGGSSSNATTSTYTNQAEFTGPANIGDGTLNIKNEVSDLGAIREAFDAVKKAFASGITGMADVSHDALNLGSDALDANARVTQYGLDHALAAYKSSLTTVSDALDRVADVSTYSTDKVARFAGDSLNAVINNSGDALGAVITSNRNVLDFASDLVGDVFAGNLQLVDQNLQGVQALAGQVSQSSQQVVSTGIQRVALYAFLAVGAILVAQAMAKSK